MGRMEGEIPEPKEQLIHNAGLKGISFKVTHSLIQSQIQNISLILRSLREKASMDY